MEKKKSLKFKKGFTMAEVLIALVIIGVIATMTIPSTITNKKNKETLAKLKKTQSILSQTLSLARLYNGEFTTWPMRDNDNQSVKRTFQEYVMPYVKTLKICYNETGCWSEEMTKSFNGSTTAANANSYGIGNNITSFVLSDGTFISMDIWGDSIETSFGVTNNLFYPTIVFTADVNGDKGPNKMGKDVFNFVLTRDGLVPAGKDNGGAMCSTSSSSSYAGFDCAAKYIRQDSTSTRN